MTLELQRYRGESSGESKLQEIRAKLESLHVSTWNPLRERSGHPHLDLYERRKGWCVEADDVERDECWKHPKNPYGALGHPGGGYWPVYHGVEKRSGHKVYGLWRRV